MNLYSLSKIPRSAVVTVGLLGLLAAGNPMNAAEDSVELLPRWKKGEKLRFEMVKSRQKTQGDNVTLKTTTRTDLEIEVLSASKDGLGDRVRRR